MKEAISSYVALEEERRRLTLEALADAAAGRTHDHAGVEAWTRALGKPKRKRRR